MGASLSWGGSSLAGNSCRRQLNLVAGSWRNAAQAPGPALLRGSLDWRERERRWETGTTAQIWRRTVCRILLADAISAPMPGKNCCLQAVRQFTFHCKFPQLQQLYPPRHAKARQGTRRALPACRSFSRFFAFLRVSLRIDVFRRSPTPGPQPLAPALPGGRAYSALPCAGAPPPQRPP